MRLLYRFFEPDSGEILIAGKNIKDLQLENLRSAISVVPQVGSYLETSKTAITFDTIFIFYFFRILCYFTIQ